MSPRRLVGRILAGCLVLSALVALPTGPANADYDLGVTWPDVAVLNPDVDAYPITVVDTGPGDLFAVWAGARQAVPHDGSVDVDFPSDGQGRVEIWRCIGDVCEWAGVSSPVLSVHRSLTANLSMVAGRSRSRSPGTVTARVYVYRFAGLTDVGFDWALRDGQGSDLATGTSSLADFDWGADFDVSVPAGLTGGTYPLAVTVHGHFPAGDLVSDELTTEVVVDDVGPVLSTEISAALFFPVADGYHDYVDITTSSSEPAVYRYDLLAEDGSLLNSLSGFSEELATGAQRRWTGRAGGDLVGAGTYRIQVTARDAVGNDSVTVTEPFTVDLARRKTVTTRTELAPSKVVYDKFVGKCSSLVSPSSHRWKFSLGYYSQTRCKRDKGNASAVVVWHAWWLPTSMRGLKSYETIWVDQYGGPAVGHARSYMVMGYIDTAGAFGKRVQFNRGVRWHSATSVTSQYDFEHWIRYQGGRPYVVWSNGLTAGSRYDIKTFSLNVRFEALVEPDGSFIEAPSKAAWASPAATRSGATRAAAPTAAPRPIGAHPWPTMGEVAR